MLARILAVMAVVLLFPQPANCQGLALGGRAGTLGFGVEGRLKQEVLRADGSFGDVLYMGKMLL